LITGRDPLGDGGRPQSRPRREPICERQDLAAVVNFNFGVSCGKRDSRVYHQLRLSKEEGGEGEVTNPGEWPWAALIFNGRDYVGSGVLLDNDVVVTTATKVKDFLRRPEDLTIRVGDFDPTTDFPNSVEDFPHVEMDVDCIKIHPRADYPDTLRYNVAVLKMHVRQPRDAAPEEPERASAVSVVDIRSAPRRPANQPEGVRGFRRNQDKEEAYGDEISLRQGLLSDLNNEVDPLGEPISGDAVDPEQRGGPLGRANQRRRCGQLHAEKLHQHGVPSTFHKTVPSWNKMLGGCLGQRPARAERSVFPW